MEITYHEFVIKRDIPALDTEIKRRIRQTIEQKLSSNPLLYGVPLRATLHQLWKLRVGDYRVIFRIKNKEVLVFVIAHRSVAYKIAEKRI